jgi:hypothetical protein
MNPSIKSTSRHNPKKKRKANNQQKSGENPIEKRIYDNKMRINNNKEDLRPSITNRLILEVH